MVVHSKKKNHINCAQLAQLLEVKLFCVANSTVVESLWELANCGFGYGHGITG